MWLARLALKNPYVVVVMALALVYLGWTSLQRIPTDILPQFKTPAVQIVTLYPGMPATVIEQDMSTRLQRWTGQSVGIEHQEAKSMLGVSIVKDFFQEDVDPNSAMSQVTSYAMSDLYYLPPGTVPPMVMPFDPTASIPLCLFSVKSDVYNEQQLYDIAYFQLRNRLQAIPGVIAPAVYGGKLRTILAYVDPMKLAGHGVSPMDVVNTIHGYNVFIPTGTAIMGPMQYLLDSNAMVSKVKDLNDFPVKLDDRAPVYLKDVGDAQDASQIQSNIVRVDGKRQLYVPIYRQPGANTIKVVDGVKDAVPDLKTRLPKGIELETVFDQSQQVRKAIGSLAEEGALGSLLAAIMVFLFLRSLRSTFFILLSLPLSLLAAVVGLYFMGHTINAITLGGFAISVGLLIDQSIVVLENTERHLAMGKAPAQAALDGAIEVAKPVLVIVVGTCIVFFPVVFLTGIAKFLFTPLSLAVVLSLVASYVMAMMVVPVCCAFLLKAHAKEERRGLFERMRDTYGRVLQTVLDHRMATLVVTGGIFGFAVLAVYPLIGRELFPQVESGQFTIRARCTSGTYVDETEKVMTKVEQVITDTIGKEHLDKLITNIGVFNDWPAAYTPNSGPHDTFLLVQLKEGAPKGDRAYMADLRRTLTDKFPGVEFAFEPMSVTRAAVTFGLPAPINLRVQGNDLFTDMRIAEDLRKRIAAVQGTIDARIQQRLDYPQLQLTIDRQRVAELGLTQEDVVQNVATALNSSVSFAKSFWISPDNGNHYFIGAQYPETAFQDLDTVLNVPITGKGQSTPVLLRNVAKVERTTAPTEVNHYNINRVIDVFADVEGRDLGSVSDEVERQAKEVESAKDFPSGYKILRMGEVKSMEDTFARLGVGLLGAAILVYLVMVIQFRSLLDPLIVLIAVPLGFIGVIAALYGTHTFMSIQSLMGVIMMIGIVKSFSLLMIDFANRRRAEGASPREAILDAAKVRLRPILMTAIAAALGLVPMAVAGGANAPLARAVIGGVTASTFLILFVVPVIYTLFKRERVHA